MSKTRFAKWIVLGCIGTLAACTSGEDGTAGNTELNVIIPNGADNGSSAPGAVDIQTVEYTIKCNGNDDTFLDNGASFVDAVTINGNLEVNEADPVEAPGINPSSADVFQGFMDLPPGNCSAEFRARDADGEVICSDREGFTVAADSTIQVNLVMYCGLSFQAPVGMADIAGTFSFNVANFCPDLFVLNCLETFPAEPVDGAGVPTGDPASTTCEVRLRDGDQSCGTACDPQECEADGLNGLICTQPGGPVLPSGFDPGADPGTTTTVSCAGAAMDCDGLGGPDDTECTYVGDQLGTLAINTGIVGNAATFDVNCGLSQPGAQVTCTATTTDGDEDCDKTKVVSFDCPGLNFCDVAAANDNLTDCQNLPLGPGAEADTCLVGSCNRTTQACETTPVAAGGGNNCTFSGSPAGECDGNDPPSCVPFGCQTDADCDPNPNDCFVAPANACELTSGICCGDATNGCQAGDLVAGNAGGFCDESGTGSDFGTCDTPATGVCESDDECDGDPATCPTPGTICLAPTCDIINAPYTCDVEPANENGDCDVSTGGVGDDGVCRGGACVVKVFNDVCQRFAPVAVPSTSTCDGSSPAQTCICEKAEFLAIDCELIGNSAPLPLQASAQQFGIATAGSPVSILPQDAIVLAADLICGFIGAGFQSALVDDSQIEATYTNAIVTGTTDTSSALASFVNPAQPAPGALVSPHGAVFFNFGDACGDNCSGTPLTCDDGTTPCTLATFTTDCSQDNGGSVGTGSGIVAPFFANAATSGSIPPGPIPGNLVSLTPTAAGNVEIGLPYSGIALELPDVGGLASGCAGGACRGTCAITTSQACASNADCPAGAADTCGGVLCATLDRGTETSPRVMFDAECNKLGFAACGGTDCLTDADCPFNSAAIGGFTPGQTCDTSAGTPGVCTDVNTGSCGFVLAGFCPDVSTSCGSCSDADGNTGTCSNSGFPCAVDIDCPFGVADLCSAPTACAVNTDCTAPFGTCELSDDRCNPVIEAISGGAVSTCCGPFEFFTSTSDVCKDKLPPEDQEVAPPCCNQLLPNPAGTNKDVFCENPTNKASCCAAIATEFPLATPAQNPQLWVNAP